MQSHAKTRTLVECGLMIAVSTVLSNIKLFEMPMGGTITICSTLPLLMVSFRHGVKWGVFTGTAHGILQTLFGIKNVLYCTTLLAQIGCVLLDYIVAYAVLGTACIFADRFKNRTLGITVAVLVTGFARFFCSFLSGILIWGGYAPEGRPVWLYSLSYNGSFMLPETIITVVGAIALVAALERRIDAPVTAD